MDQRNNLNLLDFQHPSELEILQPQSSRLHRYDRLYGVMVEEKANPISIKIVEFYQPKVEAIIQALPPRCCYVGGIDLTNIIYGSKMHHVP